MKKLKITLKNLFRLLETDNTKIDELSPVNVNCVFVKTPKGDFVSITGTIRKMDDKIKITTNNGSIICGKHHIFIDQNNKEVFAKDATHISTIHGVQLITSKVDVGYGLVYDISIPTPHLYVTPNGMIHHNTTFIRGLLAHTKKSAALTYHQEILKQDAFYVDFFQSKESFLVMEDADLLLLPRSDGNSMMSLLLNTGDGLISVQGKKLIFSTNLSSHVEMDDAITRAGRAFDILSFRALERDEAKVVANKFDHELGDGNSFTISEIFAAKNNVVPTSNRSKFGFV